MILGQIANEIIHIGRLPSFILGWKCKLNLFLVRKERFEASTARFRIRQMMGA